MLCPGNITVVQESERRVWRHTTRNECRSGDLMYGVITKAFQVLFDPSADLQNLPRNAFSFSE